MIFQLYSPTVPAEFREAVSVATTVGMLVATSPLTLRFVYWLKIVGMIATALLGALAVVLIAKLQIFSFTVARAKAFTLMRPSAESDKMVRQWSKLRARLAKASDADDRLAVIEADQFFDYILRQLNVPGDTTAKRLEHLKSWRLTNLPDLWIAHKMRNRLVHEPGSRITHFEAETAVKTYEKALKELGILS